MATPVERLQGLIASTGAYALTVTPQTRREQILLDIIRQMSELAYELVEVMA